MIKCAASIVEARHPVRVQRLVSVLSVVLCGGALLFPGGATAQRAPAFHRDGSWDLLRARPLVEMELTSPGHQVALRTIAGIYEKEFVCYLESLSTGSVLHFGRGTDTPRGDERPAWEDAVVATIGAPCSAGFRSQTPRARRAASRSKQVTTSRACACRSTTHFRACRRPRSRRRRTARQPTGSLYIV
jgi:hypothetical protein